MTRFWQIFHEDESGNQNVLTPIMLLAVGAIIIVLLIAFGRQGMEYLQEWWDGEIAS